MQMPNCFGYFSVFVDACENVIMVDDVTTPSNPPVTPIEKEDIKETPFNVNVFIWSCEEKPSKKVVRTLINHLAWDYRLFPSPHALAMYLNFFPTHGATPKRFEECQCEDDDVRLHCRTWVPNDGHYRRLQGPINPLSMEHQAKYLVRTIRRILNFFAIVIYPL
jgi:hypothetical protein